MSSEHVRQAAVHVHTIANFDLADGAVGAGFDLAANVLRETGDFFYGNSQEAHRLTDDFVRAASAVITHREEGSGLDFSESALDIARMTLAAWSFDRMIDEQLGLDVPSAEFRFAGDVVQFASVAQDDGTFPLVADETLLDRNVSSLFRDAVIAAASIPNADPIEERPQWEQDAIARHGGDELLGHGSIAHDGLRAMPAESAETVHEAMLDVGNARHDLMHRGEAAASLDARKDVALARRTLSGELPSQLEAVLAVEAYLKVGLGRPLRSTEDRMVERAYDRIMEGGPIPVAFEASSRTMLLDVSVQMQAARTMEEVSFGRRAVGSKEIFDEVISASAGMDTHASGISPDAETTRLVSEGVYRSLPDRRIAASILDGLMEASSKPYSKTIDSDIAFQSKVVQNTRSRLSAVLEEGPEALTRGFGKGPKQSEVATMGTYVASKGTER